MSITTGSSTSESVNNQQAINLHKFNKRGVALIDFETIVHSAFFKTNQIVYSLGIEEDYSSVDVKNLFFNHAVHDLCEFIKNRNTKLKPLIYITSKPYTRPYYVVDDKFEKTVLYLISKILKLLPIVIIKGDLKYNEFLKKVAYRDADAISLLDKGVAQIYNRDIVNISFQKIKRFLKTHGLTFLDESYFRSLQTKLLFIT